LNEGNPLKNFQFEFSTGSEFDSLYLGGIMHDAFNFSTEAGWYILLYDKFNDTIPRTTLPNFVAKTDENGQFFVTNLKKKPYYIFGLYDLNNNLLFDLPNEKIAFLDSTLSPGFEEKVFVDTLSIIQSVSNDLKDTIRVDSLVTHKHMVTNIGNVRMYMFVEDFEQQYFIQSYRPEKQQIIFSFNKEIKDSISVVPLVEKDLDSDWILQEKLETHDSLVYWITDTSIFSSDSLWVQLNYTMKDSSQNNYIKTDTLLLRYTDTQEKKVDTKKEKKGKGRINLDFLNTSEDKGVEDTIIPPSELTFIHNAKSPFDLNRSLELQARFPIKFIDRNRFVFSLVEDDTVKTPKKFKLSHPEFELRNYIMSFEKDEEESYELLIPAGAITDIYGNINDTLLYSFNTRTLDYYSTISMKIVDVKDLSIVQILDDKQIVLEERTIYSDTTLFFDYLAPSKYQFKLYYDSNKNGKWDTGNFKELKQAEKVFYYPFLPETLETKSNVDIENTWELYPVKTNTPNAPHLKSNTSEH
jgi:hypothetical protein